MNNVLKGTIATTGTMTGNLGTVFGKDGKSAYEVAVKNGYEGTEEAWLWSLKGEKGDTGKSGVYLGSGDMPEDCNVQIDPEGTPMNLNDYVSMKTYSKHLSDFSTVARNVSNKANKSDVYTKEEVAVNLGKKADKTEVNSKVETLTISIASAKSEAKSDDAILRSSLEAAIEAVATSKADKDTVYTKTETDAAINAGDEALANQLVNLLDEMGSFIEEQYYRKSETDALLKNKANKTTTEATLAKLSLDMLSKASFENIMALDAKIGDIDSALDELHNYALSLIGGEA